MNHPELDFIWLGRQLEKCINPSLGRSELEVRMRMLFANVITTPNVADNTKRCLAILLYRAEECIDLGLPKSITKKLLQARFGFRGIDKFVFKESYAHAIDKNSKYAGFDVFTADGYADLLYDYWTKLRT